MLTLALIGRGRWGQNIERTLREFPGIELVVAANTTDAKKIDKSDIDGALIATPGSTHIEVALPFVQAGLPVFIEKPLATSLTQAGQLKSSLKRKGLLQVGHIHLYNPAYLAAKKAAKKIGKIRLLYFEGLAPGPVRDDMSVWWDWGPHGVSLVLDLLGAMPERVQGWGLNVYPPNKGGKGGFSRQYDAVQARLIFPSGAEMLLTTSWLSPEKRTRLTIVGENGSVIFDDRAEKKVTYFQANGAISHPRYGNEPALRVELKQFVRMIKTKQPVLTDINEGLSVMTVLDAVEKSIRAGGALQKIS